MKYHSGNVSAAARALNVSRNTIYRWLSISPVAERKSSK